MQFDKPSSLPFRFLVKEILDSRYGDNGHERPLSWDDRGSGIDVVIAEDGKTYRLWSDGGQSPPKKGWIVLLREEREDGAYAWTLYGMQDDSDA